RLLLAPGGDQQADQRFGRLGIVGRTFDPGAHVGEQVGGGKVAGDQLGADLVEPGAAVLAGGYAPGVEIVAIGQVEITEEQAGGGGADLLQLLGRGGGGGVSGVFQLDEVAVGTRLLAAFFNWMKSMSSPAGSRAAVSRSATIASPKRPRNFDRLQRSAPLGSSGISQNRWQSRSRRTGFASAAREAGKA